MQALDVDEARDDAGIPNPVAGLGTTLCQGISSSGMYYRDYLYFGFNEDERGQTFLISRGLLRAPIEWRDLPDMGAIRMRCPCNFLRQRGIDGKFITAAAIAGHGRARMVGGQLQHRMLIAQLCLPVRQLPRLRRPSRPPPLPDGVVRVLRRGLGKGRDAALAVRAVHRPQLAEKHPQAPPVGDGVVHGEEKDVLVRRQPQERGAKERARVQREGAQRGQRLPQRLPHGDGDRRAGDGGHPVGKVHRARLALQEKAAGDLRARVDETAEGGIAANTAGIATLDGRITTTEGDVTALSGRVGTAETDIAANTADIGTLQADLGNVQSTVGTHTTQIGALDTRVTTTEGNVTALAGRVDAAESDIASNAADIGALQTNVSNVQATVGTHTTQIGALDTRTTTAESNIVNVQATVGRHASSIGGLAQALGGGASVNPDGSIAAPTYNVAGDDYDNVGSAVEALEALAVTGSVLGVSAARGRALASR